MNPRTVMRAGFGVFLNQWAYSVQQAFSENLPFFELKSVSAAADGTVPVDQTGTLLLSTANGRSCSDLFGLCFKPSFPSLAIS
jgi:hypothetical protein